MASKKGRFRPGQASTRIFSPLIWQDSIGKPFKRFNDRLSLQDSLPPLLSKIPQLSQLLSAYIET